MDHPRIADAGATLAALASAGVEFIVIGGTAGILHGSTLATLDVDVIRRRTPENIERLLAVLQDLDAYTRVDRRRLRFDATHLAGPGALLMSTRLGPLDLLATVQDGRGYDELLPNSDTFVVGSHAISALDLPTLIEVKTAAGRDKDKLAVAHLTAILRGRQGE